MSFSQMWHLKIFLPGEKSSLPEERGDADAEHDGHEEEEEDVEPVSNFVNILQL
jgi:hypothetical protein